MHLTYYYCRIKDPDIEEQKNIAHSYHGLAALFINDPDQREKVSVLYYCEIPLMTLSRGEPLSTSHNVKREL